MFQTHPPLYNNVAAGFPSPAEDHMEGRLDVQALLVRRPAATFFCRAHGQSMRDLGIHDGDLLVVDRSITPAAGNVVVAVVDGGLTVKQLIKNNNQWQLAPANPDFPVLDLGEDCQLHIWGVVTFAITALTKDT